MSLSRHTKASKELHKYKMRVTRLVKKVRLLKNSVNRSCSICSEPSPITKHASKYLNPWQLDIFKSQLKLSGVKKRGRRYSREQRSFALNLYHKSPKAYNYMSKIFALPSQRMLRLWIHNFDFSTGWSDHVFDLLKQKVSSMEKRDKVCSITFDAISIKEGLYYNTSTDKMDGFEDLGQYGTSGKRARYAMVFMVKGIAKKWKQILGYFLYGTSIKADILKGMITDCISKLQDIGLIPKVIICDQDTCNRSVFSKFGITPQSPNIIHNNEQVFFHV